MKTSIMPMQLLYIIGSYPELTTTFIDREILTLRDHYGFKITIASVHPSKSLSSCSLQQKALSRDTLYMLPRRWRNFDFIGFLLTNLSFLVSRPIIYLNTLFQLITGDHPNFKSRLKSLAHFYLGIYAAGRLRRNSFEHIHVHFMDRSVVIALIISRFLDKTYSFTAHAVDIYKKPVLMDLKLRQASFVVTVSEYNREYLLNAVPDLPADKVFVLHPWVNVDEFSSSSKELNERLHILSVGRLVEKKGHGDLIQACSIAYHHGLNFECRIIGDGPLRNQLEEQITRSEMQGNIRLEGAKQPDQVRELMKNWADVFALPCVIAHDGDRDGIPVSLAEAMAMRLPVISTDIVGISELVHAGAGFLVKPHEPDKLARVLERISKMSLAERIEMGRCGRAIVETSFDLRKGTQQLVNLFLTCRR